MARSKLSGDLESMNRKFEEEMFEEMAEKKEEEKEVMPVTPDFRPYSDLLQEIRSLEHIEQNLQIVFKCSDVVICYVEPTNEVFSSFRKNDLVVYKIESISTEILFLQCETWNFPFTSKLTYHVTDDGMFLFPNIYSEVKGSVVALILPDDSVEPFKELMNQIREPEPSLTSTEIADRSKRSAIATETKPSKILTAANYVANSLVRGSDKLSSYLDSATFALINHMQPQLAAPVNPKIKTVAKTAAQVSGTAANASEVLASKVESAITALATYVSPYVQDKVIDKSNTAQVTMNALGGMLTVYDGLQNSASILSRCLANNMVKVVDRRYGEPTAQVMTDVLSTVGNAYYATHNLKVLRPKTFTKEIVKKSIINANRLDHCD